VPIGTVNANQITFAPGVECDWGLSNGDTFTCSVNSGGNPFNILNSGGPIQLQSGGEMTLDGFAGVDIYSSSGQVILDYVGNGTIFGGQVQMNYITGHGTKGRSAQMRAVISM